jgi:hypothetical protein
MWAFVPALLLIVGGGVLIPFRSLELPSTLLMVAGMVTFALGLLVRIIVGPIGARLASAALVIAILAGVFVLLVPSRPRGAFAASAVLIVLVVILGRRKLLAS